ncbi:MAG TPA: alpha/beta hydrolase [Candidatus Krumholzibacteria bacterium]|nr:alpha/beta hydrolase [Candidatus Krumholzibacteria bacterium]
MNHVSHQVLHGLYTRQVKPGCTGDGDGCLLFVHGLGESGLCFEHLLDSPALGGRRLLVPDLPGYGRTPRDGRTRSLADSADELAAWLDLCGVRRAAVLGHSMGGVIAVLLAERHPDLVSLVIDVDGNTSPGDCVYSGRAAAMPQAEFIAGGHAAMMDDLYRAGLEDRAQRGYYTSQRLCDPAVFHRHSAELVAASAPEDLARRRAALKAPVVYIAGEPRGACARSRQLLQEAGVDVRAVGPSGHWPFIDQPEAFLAVLADILAENA